MSSHPRPSMKSFKKCCTSVESVPLWGIGSYTATWNLGVDGYPAPRRPWNAFDILHEAAHIGCTLIQLCENSHLERMTDEQLEHLRAAAWENGITIELGTRGVDAGVLKEQLRLTQLLGARRVRTLVDGPNSHPDAHTAIRYLRQSMPCFEEMGVELMLENHDLRRSTELRQIIESVASPNLGVCIDTVNSLGILETQKDVLDALLPYVRCLHLKDFSIHRLRHGMGFCVEGTPVGEGLLAYEALFETVLKQNPRASVVIELWTPWQGDIEQTARLERDWLEQSGRTVAEFLHGAQEKLLWACDQHG